MKSSPSFEVPPFFRRSHHPRLTVLISFRIFHVSQHLRIEYVQCTHACTQQHKLHVLIIVKQKRSRKKRRRGRKTKRKPKRKFTPCGLTCIYRVLIGRTSRLGNEYYTTKRYQISIYCIFKYSTEFPRKPYI